MKLFLYYFCILELFLLLYSCFTMKLCSKTTKCESKETKIQERGKTTREHYVHYIHNVWVTGSIVGMFTKHRNKI